MSLYVDIEKSLGTFQLKAKFEAGEGITGLLGASGCGKSLTLKCIAGIEKPDRGRIVLDGRVLFDSEKNIDLKPRQRQVGYLFQNYALFPNMTVKQNILCGLHNKKNKAERYADLVKALKLFQLEGLEDHRPYQLSGGQQQRVALARIMVNKPALLMLDEPFSALDQNLRTGLRTGMLNVLREYGHPVLLVTHDRDEAYHMCGAIAVMTNGLVSTPVETRELFKYPGSVAAAVLTGVENIVPAAKAGTHLLKVPCWGMNMETAYEVPDDTTHLGVRAGSFNTDTVLNRSDVRFAADFEELFEWEISFRYASQSADTEAVRWRVSKNAKPLNMPEKLGVEPVNVLPLTGMINDENRGEF